MQTLLPTSLTFPWPSMNINPTFFLIILPFIFIFLKRKTSKKINIPPGPKRWPVIGNLLHMGQKAHVSLARLAEIHGPLISLRLGTQLLVVASSPETAAAILKTQDRELSGRHVPHVSFARDPKLNRDSIAWSNECNDEWKSFRALMRTELFSTKNVESQSVIREKAAKNMIDFVDKKEGKKVAIRDVVYVYTFNALSNIYFSRDFMEFEGLESQRVSGLVREMMMLWSAPNVSDLYPIIGGLDLQGLKRKADACVKNMCHLWDPSIIQRRKSRKNDSASGGGDDLATVTVGDKDFLDVLLDCGFDDEQISYVFLELLAAVSDGSTSTVEWALAELMKNPVALLKLRKELSQQITGRFIHEADLPNLPYLYAIIKETLRLHPPAPLLLPRRAPEDTQLLNYTIPKDSQILVNVWAISRDPTIWTNSLGFEPERFLDSQIDYKGNDFEYLPFGAGRRICAGMVLASRQVRLALANLVQGFEWSLPDGVSVDQLDMEELFGVTLLKETPLVLVPKKINFH